MEWHTRMTGFLLMCFVLLGLNVVATVSGVYQTWQASDDEPATLISIENIAGGTG